MQLTRLIIFAARTNLCSESIFPMVLVSTDCLFSERIFPMILAPTDRSTHFLGLEMTQTQLICDPRLKTPAGEEIQSVNHSSEATRFEHSRQSKNHRAYYFHYHYFLFCFVEGLLKIYKIENLSFQAKNCT